MKLTKFKWMASGLMLSTLCLGAGAISFGTSPEATGSAIHWKDHVVGGKETNEHVASHTYAKSLSGAFRGASEKVMPAVVTIQSFSAKKRESAQQGVPEEFRNNPLFKRFFDNVPDSKSREPGGSQRIGMGSGVIIDPSGILLTNNHVVDGADKLLIKLHDGREFEATVPSREASGSRPARNFYKRMPPSILATAVDRSSISTAK
ncbi:MAG: hypothetical protein ACOVLE_00935 [Pirellula staleyi]